MNGNRAGEFLIKTPGFRVVPDESSLTVEGASRKIPVNVTVPQQSRVLPKDIISDVIKRHRKWIAVAECYCRKAKRLIGEGCDYPLETCITFQHIAQTLIKTGFARKIDYEEAVDIIHMCEDVGLVHHADNCEENIHTLCNCCPCCCGALNMLRRGQSNVISPSRFVVFYENEKCSLCEKCLPKCPTHARSIQGEKMVVHTNQCIGCGLCVTVCPQGANGMVFRDRSPKIFSTREKLYGKLTREALWGIAKRKVFGE